MRCEKALKALDGLSSVADRHTVIAIWAASGDLDGFSEAQLTELIGDSPKFRYLGMVGWALHPEVGGGLMLLLGADGRVYMSRRIRRALDRRAAYGLGGGGGRGHA
jgi:hypothetical protein